MNPSKVFEAVLRQWGIDTTDLRSNTDAVAKRVAAVKGSGNLVVTHEDGDTLTVPCASMFEASNHVLRAIAMLSAEALRENDARYVEHLTPAMFQWVPNRRDVVTTADADAVIAKIMEAI